jgi:phosphomannomutase
VVRKMKEVHAVIGGEGNGGIIYPELHYGRDALVGIALILSLMATKDKTLHHIKASYPSYYMYKDKIELDPDMDFKKLTDHLSKLYSDAKMNVIDGLKLDFPESWIHLRKSNTEPIVRIYSEAREQNVARALCEQIKTRIQQF